MNEDEFIERCENDFSFFATNLLYKGKRRLSPKQLEFANALRTESHAAAIFNRQGGKTEVFAGWDVRELCYERTKDDEPIHIIMYAPILSQTDIIMGRIHQFFNTSPLLQGFIRRGAQNKYNIEMLNGNTIQALSASEQSHVRGHSPTHIQIDETQDISDRMYYDDILPSGAATGAKIQETGTPKGRNHFFELTRSGVVTMVYQHWEECPFINREYVLKRKRHMPRAKFEAEFCNKFLGDTDVAFSTKMLDAVISIDLDMDIDLSQFKSFYLGADIGKQDETVIVVLGWTGEKLFMVDMRRMSAFESYTVVRDELKDVYDTYKITHGLMDITGVGEGVFDFLPKGLGLDGKMLENNDKQEMVDSFMIMGEGETDEGFDPLIYLWNDYDLRQQFYEWEAKKLKSGKFRYHHPAGCHDDIVIAALLAVQAYRDDQIVIDYGHGSSTGRSPFDTEGVLVGGNPLDLFDTKNPYLE